MFASGSSLKEIEGVGTGLSERARHHRRWHGRRALLMNGTTVSMPDTAANQKVYPQPGRRKPGLGFPLARLVALGRVAPCRSKTSAARFA